jgi:hypothetical protein
MGMLLCVSEQRQDLGMSFGLLTRAMIDAEKPLLDGEGVQMWGWLAWNPAPHPRSFNWPTPCAGTKPGLSRSSTGSRIAGSSIANLTRRTGATASWADRL